MKVQDQEPAVFSVERGRKDKNNWKSDTRKSVDVMNALLNHKPSHSPELCSHRHSISAGGLNLGASLRACRRYFERCKPTADD